MKLALPLVFIFVLMLSCDAIAQGRYAPPNSGVKEHAKAQVKLRVKSSKQAAKIVKSRLGGKVLKVQKKKTGYRVKLIKNNGHIVSVNVDAKTGRVSGGQ